MYTVKEAAKQLGFTMERTKGCGGDSKICS